MQNQRWAPVPSTRATTLGDHRRYPGCRLLVTCGLCGWSKSYRPERIIARLHELRSGGEPTPLRQIAGRVAWNCPGCGRLKWRAELAWPPELDDREKRRLANLHRN